MVTESPPPTPPGGATPGAGNGLYSRRALLGGGATLLAAGAAGATSVRPPSAANAGAALRSYGKPSAFEATVQRQRIRSAPGTLGSGASATPLQHLHGTITPNSLHFERHHAGVPSIYPNAHRLLIHGLVERALSVSLDDLARLPMVSITRFLECSGNSAPLLQEIPVPWGCADIHGLVSNSEWTGVPLATLLDAVGVQPEAQWVVAEGADAALMNRSVPLQKAMDDALIALYQNGERLRPEQGYPLRLLLPGWEGNMSIKWLHRLELSQGPAYSREETSKYSDLRPDGRAELFTFPMAVKSVITQPSPGRELTEPGLYQISGLAWSGAGRIRRVEVSADGGATWLDADFSAPPEPLAMARFQAAWHWQGQPGVLLSRATDDSGAVQPARDAWLAARGQHGFYHYNAIQAWRVSERGTVHNHYVA